MAGADATAIASGLVFLRNRIQVPRDMSASAAATLREMLFATAASLVGAPRALALLREHEGAYAFRQDFRSRETRSEVTSVDAPAPRLAVRRPVAM